MSSFHAIQFFSFVVVSLLCFSLSKKTITQLIISFIFVVAITVQIVSFYCGESFINEFSFLHFTVRDIPFISKLTSSLKLISLVILLFSLIAVIFYVLFYVVNKISLKNISNKIKYLSVLSLFVVLTLEGGIYKNIFNLLNIQLASEISFDQALERLGIPSKSYVKPGSLVAESGKNIIIVSMESLEKGFIEDSPLLTPNLNKLKQSMTYFDMQQNDGSAITVSSMYTFLTGIPMYFSYETLHNMESIIGDYSDHKSSDVSYRSKISSLTYVLEKAGYFQLYLSGGVGFNGSFGSTKSILDAYHVNLKSQYNQSINGWARDSKIFEDVKSQINILSQRDKPFVLYISTISTHGPRGLYDKAMESKIGKKSNTLDFSIASLDYLVGDLITTLENSNILDNTVIFLFPDHKFMFGANNKFDNDRGLFLMTNASFDRLSYLKNQVIQQIDLPKIILEGAEVKHNAKFLTDYIDGNKWEFIHDNKTELSQLNEASIRNYSAQKIFVR